MKFNKQTGTITDEWDTPCPCKDPVSLSVREVCDTCDASFPFNIKDWIKDNRELVLEILNERKKPYQLICGYCDADLASGDHLETCHLRQNKKGGL